MYTFRHLDRVEGVGSCHNRIPSPGHKPTKYPLTQHMDNLCLSEVIQNHIVLLLDTTIGINICLIAEGGM